MPNSTVHPEILALCKQVTAKRARTVIDHILKHGQITTEELQETYGYDHPPRAARDVREEGVPLETKRITSARTGRKIAVYTFGDPSEIKKGRIGGRQAFPKQFKEALIARYGERDAISSQHVEARYLQIDHRIPYEVAGDGSFDVNNLEAYMLLDASSQRAKSWSCEHCENSTKYRDLKTCETCYWAYPESYTHVAMEPARRIDVLWTGDQVLVYLKLEKRAQSEGITVKELAKRLLSE